MKNSKVFFGLIYFLFFLSGLNSLICEIAWKRMLVLAVGNTVSAASVVVASFLAGLGIGSYAMARYLRGRRGSLKIYAWIQVCLGVCVMLSPFVLRALPGFLSSLSLPSGTLLASSVRWVLISGILLVPTFFMGATFPAIVASTSFCHEYRRSAHAGYLYSLNAFGAALGAFLSGYILLPLLGFQITMSYAWLLNFTIAAGAFILSDKMDHDAEPADSDPSLKSRTKLSVPREGAWFLPMMIFVVFMAGFIVISYEMMLVRMIVLFFGNVHSAFALVLTAFLLAMGISSFLGTWLHGRMARTKALLGSVLLGAGLFMLATFALILKTVEPGAMPVSQGWGREGVLLMSMVLPVLFLGSIVPLSIKIFHAQKGWSVPFLAGRLYALGTLGGVLGALVTCAGLIPMLGSQATLAFYSVLLMWSGICFLGSRQSWGLRMGIVVAGAGFSLVALLSPSWVERIYLSSLEPGTVMEASKAEWFKEGKAATITVLDSTEEGRLLFLNGVEEVSTRLYHVQLFKALGMIPFLFHENEKPKDVLVIAFGAGISAGATLDTGQVKTLDVVDIVPEAETISRYFKELNGDIFKNPKFKFIAEDGRNYLLRTQKKYSVIICDATHPYSHDSWLLYTKEFYEEVRKHLTPDGIFVQWLPLSIEEGFFRVFLNTFSAVFRHNSFWNIYGSDQAFIMATPQAFGFDVPGIQQRLDAMPDSAQLKEYQLDQASQWAGFFVMGEKRIKAQTREELLVNADLRSFNEKFEMQSRFNGGVSILSMDGYQESIVPYLRRASSEQRREAARSQVLANAMMRFHGFGDMEALREAMSIDHRNRTVLFFSGEDAVFAPQLRAELERNVQEDVRAIEQRMDTLARRIERGAEKRKDLFELAWLYSKVGYPDLARPLLARLLEEKKGDIEAHRLKGIVEMQMDNLKEAEKMFQYILNRRPKDLEALAYLINVYDLSGKYVQEIQLLLERGADLSPWNRGMTYKYYEILARAYYKIKEYSKAEKNAFQSLEEYSRNHEARRILANIYRHTSRPQQSVDQLNEILKTNPYHIWALESLVVYYQEFGFQKQAQLIIQMLEELKQRKAAE